MDPMPSFSVRGGLHSVTFTKEYKAKWNVLAADVML